MINTGLFTQSLAGADPASSAISDECDLAGPLSSRPLACFPRESQRDLDYDITR